MEVAPLGLAALHSKELGIVFMLAFVECHHMEWLAKDLCFDECGLACHANFKLFNMFSCYNNLLSYIVFKPSILKLLDQLLY